MKISCTILVVTLAVFLFGGVASAGFTDVSDNHWAAVSIKKMSDRGMVSGYTDGTFKPDKTVTQTEAVVFALRAMGLNSSSVDNLPDVSFPVPAWAEQDIKLAVKQGLVKEADQFSAYSGASRAWTARLLVRMVGEEKRALEELLQPSFTDAYEIPDWADEYVRVAQDMNLIRGYDNNQFRPNQTVSRAEMVAFLDRADTHLPGSTSSDSTSTDLTITGSAGQFGSKVSGRVLKIYPERNTFVIVQQNGINSVLSLPENASVSVEGSGSSGLNAMRQGDEVEVTLNTEGYVIGIVVNSRSAGGRGNGIVFDLDLDLDPGLLTVEYDDGTLTAYKLARQVAVFMDGARYPTLLDVHNGDRIRLTVEDHLVTEIEVLEKDVTLNMAGEVVVLDTDRDVINLDIDGVLKAYRLARGVKVTVPGLNNAYLSDIEVGDTVRASGKDGEITLLEVDGREAGYSFSATIVAVDTGNQVLTLEKQGGDIVAYELLKNARIIIDDDEEDLQDLARDMEVNVRLLDGDIIFVEVDNSPAGTITDIDVKGMLLVLNRDNGIKATYTINDRVRVRSTDDRDELNKVQRGDYAKLILNNDQVDEIRLRYTIACRVENVREANDRLEVVDEDGDSLRLYVRDGVELVVPGTNYPHLDDVFKGDLVLATYMGRDLDKVEVLKPYRGSVSSLDVYSRSVTLKLFDGGVKNFSYPTGSQVFTGGRAYDSFSALSTGDMVEVVENTSGGYTFTVMEEVIGNLAADVNSDAYNIYLRDGYDWDAYELDENVYVQNAGGYTYSINSLQSGDSVRLYVLRDLVYAIKIV